MAGKRRAARWAAVAVFAAAAGTSLGDRVRLDGAAAYVGDRAITIGDVLDRTRAVREQLTERYTGRELDRRAAEVCRRALDSLVERELVLDAYKEQKGKLPEWVVDRRIQEILHEMFKGDREAMMAALARDGLTQEEWREEIRSQLIVATMRAAAVEDKIRVASDQVRRAYDERKMEFSQPGQVRLRMLVLKKDPKGGDVEEKRVLAGRLLRRVRDGEDFGMVAKAESQGARASEGGDLGWMETASLRADLREAAERLAVGGTSEPIESGEDIVLLRLEGRREPSTRPFGDVSVALERELRRAESARLHAAWIERLARDVYVSYPDPKPFGS